jgi:hypothetical protein
MEEWLNMFNAKMKKENRNVILYLDDATCHELSNVKIAWFPANATSVLQPINMGVIYTFKSHYRRFLIQSLISNAVLRLQTVTTFTFGRAYNVKSV